MLPLYRCFVRTITCLLLFSSDVVADWQEVKHSDKSIKTFTRDIAGSSYREFKGEVIMQTSMASLVALFDDTAACPKWIFECRSAQEIDVIDFSERYIYQVNTVHRFATTRDYIVHSKMVQHPGSENISIYLKARPDYCIDNSQSLCQKINRSNFIRVTRLVGRFDLEQIDEQHIKVSWTQHIEPAGYLLKYITNYLLDNIPYRTLKKMRKIVIQNKYRLAEFIKDSSGVIVGIQQ